MGGMTTAALLSKLGKRVLVLEQHYEPGGFTHTFKRKRWTWDVGVHAVGEVTEKSFVGRTLTALTDGRLEWESLGSHYEEFNYPDGFEIQFPDNPTQFRQNLLDAFPDDQVAIDNYLAEVREHAGVMRGYYLSRTFPKGLAGRTADLFLARKAQRLFQRSAREVVRGLTSNPRLRSVMLAQWGYYGAPSSRASFAMQALLTRHYLWGAYYPRGGSAQIASGLLGTVANSGGWTTVSADVEEILIEKRRAVGVRLANGDEIRSPRVVSAAGVASTLQRLLPEEHRATAGGPSVNTLRPGPAHVCLYIGFEGDIREAGCGSANQWFYRTWDTEAETWEVDSATDPDAALPDAPLLYCSFPSLKDPLHEPGPDRLHTGEVVTFVDWDLFDRWRDSRWKRRQDDYEAFKERLRENLLEQFLREIPALRPYVRFSELSTPLSTEHFCRPIRGSIYGLEPTPERFENDFLRPRSKIRNLFFSGSEVATMGIVGAMMGGVMAAVSAEPTKAVRFLRGLA